MTWLDQLIENYYLFLREKTLLKEDKLSGWTEIRTPIIGIFNDGIDIYAKKENGEIILSDDGETLRNLELSGAETARSSKRKELLKQILLNYGVELKEQELITKANEQNFPQKKLNMLSAITEANDLYFLSKHTVGSVFREDVQGFLEEQKIIYTPHFLSKGSTGIEFNFDFQIAYSETEIIIKSFNNLTKMNLPHFLFTWEDIKIVRERQTGKNVIGLAMVNDEGQDIKGEYLGLISGKKAKYILWSERYKPENTQRLRAA